MAGVFEELEEGEEPADVVEESESNQRLYMKVAHCIYTWYIPNATGEIKQAMWITSPSFSLGSNEFSTWDIRFFPMIEMEETRGMGFQLRRTGSSGEPDSVFVSFRFGMTNSSGNKVWLQECRKAVFKKLDSKGHQTSLFGLTEDFLRDCDLDTMTILCEMYVGSINALNDTTIDSSQIDDLKLLSEDMTKVFTSANHPGMLLQVADKSYRVHNSILAARSRVFARMLRDRSRYLEYPDISKNVMGALLHFLYSGNLSQSLLENSFGIGLYECSKTMDICGLDEFLVPSRMFAKTSTYEEKCEFTWSIERFSARKLNVGQCISSPEFSTSIDTGCAWYMTVYPRGMESESENVMTVVVQPCLQSYEAVFMTVLVSILDLDGQPRCIKCQKKFVTSGISFVLPPLIRTSELEASKSDLLPNDLLTLHCKLRVLNAKPLLYNLLEARTPDGDRANFERLSHDLQILYDKNELKDFEFKFVAKESLKAHTAILLARSRIADSLEVIFRRNMTIREFDADLFQKMLFYMYAGTIKKLNYQEAMQLLRMARIHGVPSLWAKCRQILKSCLSVDIVFDVALFAHGNLEMELKNACFEYIRDNAEEAFHHRSWSFMKEWDLELAKEITDFCSEVSFSKTIYQCVKGFINEMLLFSMLVATIFMLRRVDLQD